MFDCHIHSNFSGDSEMPAETACEKAIREGLDGIAFTDHLDLDFPGYSDLYNIDLCKFLEKMDGLKEIYKNKIKLIKGIEVGLQPHVIDRTLNIVKSYNFDYVLASVHIIDGLDPYTNEYFDGKSKKEAYDRYLYEILFMIKNFTDFDSVAHFEFVTRKSVYDDRSLRYSEQKDIFDEIFKELVSKGKGFELNTGSFRDKPGIETIVYDTAVLKRYRELGGEIISLASDAHEPKYIGYKFGYFRDLLLDSGFKYTVHFEQRKPVYDKL